MLASNAKPSMALLSQLCMQSAGYGWPIVEHMKGSSRQKGLGEGHGPGELGVLGVRIGCWKALLDAAACVTCPCFAFGAWCFRHALLSKVGAESGVLGTFQRRCIENSRRLFFWFFVVVLLYHSLSIHVCFFRLFFPRVLLHFPEPAFQHECTK